ncbi:MAG: ChaN family lipoprotein [Proteobacteria bacterium]|nr:ChaN family lipoprotein [Pseudomonadota bacterium]
MLSCTNSVSLNLEPEILSATQKSSLLQADIILLGEQHDNPFHHQLQTEIVELLGQKNRLGAILFEQLDESQQPFLNTLTSRKLAQLPSDLNWEKSGWPSFTLYEPIFKVAIRYKSKLIAGNIAKEKAKAIYKMGYSEIFTSDEQKFIGLDRELPPEAKAELQHEIFEGHCQILAKEQVETMVPIQRSRDAAMTLAWLKQAPEKGATVFIVGAGHARKDFGIPWYIKQIKPELKVWSIGLQEEAMDPRETSHYDQVVITPAANREDPCLALKKKLAP